MTYLHLTLVFVPRLHETRIVTLSSSGRKVFATWELFYVFSMVVLLNKKHEVFIDIGLREDYLWSILGLGLKLEYHWIEPGLGLTLD